jgi:hypothetical protein
VCMQLIYASHAKYGPPSSANSVDGVEFPFNSKGYSSVHGPN